MIKPTQVQNNDQKAQINLIHVHHPQELNAAHKKNISKRYTEAQNGIMHTQRKNSKEFIGSQWGPAGKSSYGSLVV